jgi:transcriptional regulator with XRE-family HTH domain
MAKKKLDALPGASIVAEIRTEAERRGWSEYKLAQESGISKMAIGRILRGVDRDRNDPKLSTVIKLVESLGGKIIFQKPE